jgi:hypothetical protein
MKSLHLFGIILLATASPAAFAQLQPSNTLAGLEKIKSVENEAGVFLGY